ncbi:hypothetical protein TcG_11578, partial [Trypanosoma cruzi]
VPSTVNSRSANFAKLSRAKQSCGLTPLPEYCAVNSCNWGLLSCPEALRCLNPYASPSATNPLPATPFPKKESLVSSGTALIHLVRVIRSNVFPAATSDRHDPGCIRRH